MSKVVKVRYEYVSLSDVPQVVPYPAGYSPALPTPPSVTPASVTGVSVLDQYLSDNCVSAANGYGIVNVSVASGATLPQLNLLTPAGSNLLIYNTGTARVALYTTVALVPNGTATLLVWPCEPGRITSYPGNLNTATTGVVVLTGTSPGLIVNTVAGTTGTVTVLWWM